MFDFLQSPPALLKLLLVFFIIIICIRKKLSLGNTFLFAAVALGFIFELTPIRVLTSIVNSVLDLKTLSLSIIVSLILVLSNSMENAGQMQRLLANFKGLIQKPKLNIIIFPALIGLLPMPGGAVFSAPMVKELAQGQQLSPSRQSFLNYWFRHIWEYCWPMYPGVLLITVLADISLGRLMLCMFPITLFAVFIGFWTLRDMKIEPLEKKETTPLLPFLQELLPIIIVIVPGLGSGFLIAQILPGFGISKEVGLIFALILSICYVWRTNLFSAAIIKNILFNPQMLKMIYMILSILVFKGMLEDSNTVGLINNEMIRLNLPLVFIIALLPFIVGLITGITIAFVGSAFPILIPLVSVLAPQSTTIFYIMLAMVSGFVGVLLSPVHLCLILSNEYFGTSMKEVFKHLWLPSLWLLLAGLTYFYLLQTIF